MRRNFKIKSGSTGMGWMGKGGGGWQSPGIPGRRGRDSKTLSFLNHSTQ